MSIAKALEEATQQHIRFHNRSDSELQELRARLWDAVQGEIEKLIDEKVNERSRQQSTLHRKVR
jgi:hypothetical protein